MKLTDNDKQQIYEYVMSYYSDKIASMLTESHELVPNNTRCHFLDYNDSIYAIVLRHTTPRNESPNYYPKPTHYVIYIYPYFKRIGVSDEELYRFMYVLTHFVRFSDTDDKYTKLEFVPEWKTVKLGNEIVPNMSFIDDAETRADMYEYWDEHSEELDKIAFGMRDKIDDYYIRYKPNNPLLTFVRMYHSDYCGVEIVPCRLK